MKLLKKLMSAVCVAFLASGCLTLSAAADTGSADTAVSFDENNVFVSFGAMSDIHMKVQASDHDTKFANVLQKFKQLAGGSNHLKAILIAGDLFDADPDNEAPRIMSVLQANLNAKDTEVIPSIGNHDYYFDNAFTNNNKFQDAFGAYVYQHPVEKNTAGDITYSGNYHTVINGIHFISVTGYDGNHTDINLYWLKTQLKIASKDTPHMPIFVETHVPPANTVYGSDQEGRFQSTTIGAVLEQYPQAVIFAGHTHKSAIEDTSIWRGSYTAVGTGTIADSADFVQVDKNGIVKITPYTTSTTLSDMKAARTPWVFKVNDANSATTSSTTASITTTGEKTAAAQQAAVSHWYGGEKGILLAAVAAAVIIATVVIILRIKKKQK